MLPPFFWESAGRVFPLYLLWAPFLPAFSCLLTPIFPHPSFHRSLLSIPWALPSHSLHHLLLTPPGLAILPHLFPFLIISSSDRYTYEIAPVFVLMEEEVLKKLRALVGWGSGDGVFCPGV